MSAKEKKTEIREPQTFERRYDFYWQFTTVYAIALILYVIIRGSFSDQTISIVYSDPVVILLFIFTASSALGLLYNYYKNLSVTVGPNYLSFKTRFSEKKYEEQDIVRIAFGREKTTKFRNGIRIVKIRVKSRKRYIRIRPSSFWNERKLVKYLQNLKLNIH